MLVISAPDPEDGAEASIVQSPENQAANPSPSLGGDELPNHGNGIITPSEDLLPHNPVVAHPTLVNFGKDVLAELPQTEGEEPVEANEMVEDTSGTTGKME